MRYVRNKYEVWSHNYEKKSGYYVVWECKYEIIMMYICGIDVIFMRYKTRYLHVQMVFRAHIYDPSAHACATPQTTPWNQVTFAALWGGCGTCGWVHRWWMNEKWANEWTDQWTNEWTIEQTNHQLSDQVSGTCGQAHIQWMNEK